MALIIPFSVTYTTSTETNSLAIPTINYTLMSVTNLGRSRGSSSS